MNEENELEETKYLDWKGNIIQPEDKIKLICVEEPTCEVLYSHSSIDSVGNRKSYLIPRLYDITKPINNYSLVPKEPGYKNTFKTIITYKIEDINKEDESRDAVPVIEINKITCMLLSDYLRLAREHMKNCIVAIEGKSDSESDFYSKYFEL